MPEIDDAANRKIKAVIFDMDNTLFDFVSAKQHACREVARFLDRDDGESLFGYFLHGKHGFESHENIRDYLIDRKMFGEETLARSIAIYEREKLRVLIPYPLIHEVLGEIRRKALRMAVLTDAHNGNALLRLKKLDLDQYFDCVITTDMTGCKKPAPEPFMLALKMLGTRPEETLVIGDSIRRDIAPGKHLGMITAHAAYGDRNVPAPDPSVADVVLHSVRDIADFITRICDTDESWISAEKKYCRK
ncbi:MAG: HAD family hydrolase [Methanomicrobiales archaeon]|nr:HAD family hydrolase [Methanomicrobiales archaeon]